jgi:hypothetical protein
MRRRTGGPGIGSTLLVVCVGVLLGHVCAPFAVGSDVVALAGGSVAEASDDHGHPASCEAVPQSSRTSPESLAGSPLVRFDVPAPERRYARELPGPIPRPPRFLLFVSLLN